MVLEFASYFIGILFCFLRLAHSLAWSWLLSSELFVNVSTTIFLVWFFNSFFPLHGLECVVIFCIKTLFSQPDQPTVEDEDDDDEEDDDDKDDDEVEGKLIRLFVCNIFLHLSIFLSVHFSISSQFQVVLGLIWTRAECVHTINSFSFFLAE